MLGKPEEENVKKYYVRWKETHEIEVMAEDESTALKKALEKSSLENRDSADHPIVIPA